jgi:DNA-binding response OmpR family regulator
MPFGDAVLNARASLLTVANKKLKLSRIQASIFKMLLENVGRPVSPAKVSSSPGGPKEWFARAHVSALRKKLGSKLQRRLVMVTGEGYMYRSGGGGTEGAKT